MLSTEGAWPSPTPDSERMRYENAGKCLQAITSKKPLSGESQRWRKSYEKNLSLICQTISDAVIGITTLDTVQMHAVNSIVSSAAKFWIETCSQRYRVFMDMPENSTDILSLSRRPPATMRLLVRPGLKRIGNSRGEELTREDVVSNLKLQLSEEYGKSTTRHH